ncbi:uncharacterized protein TRAVEDRAFT_48130 [Trametes versicolor FP-101664 SS1]|uniref:uncharacterized protein n=1 Tax=Trametes versicolor (strain FP-101664) TaxID=717944 RepID=UPI00046232B2|nr:uncharacterized protein TRAVEDRAFT_48130 [Trametes versicolor FP-101664 SS1]EIW59002.1 hypothetical protein TRAVEDRAFT_48130 [Trametes versicolor FP-101664 SS1]
MLISCEEAAQTLTIQPSIYSVPELRWRVALRFSKKTDYTKLVRVLAEAKEQMAAREEEQSTQMKILHRRHCRPIAVVEPTGAVDYARAHEEWNDTDAEEEAEEAEEEREEAEVEAEAEAEAQ